MVIYILSAIFLLTIIWIFSIRRKRKDYPPGPFPLPFIGNLHLLRKDIHLAMDALSKDYGSMFTLWMAHIPYIVITDANIARKIASTKKFADRLPLYVGEIIYTRGSKDIIMADYGKPLLLHRKLAQEAFHMFGEGMEKLEGRILSTTNILLQSIDDMLETDYNLDEDIDLCCFNIVSSIVLGTGLTKDDERYIKLKNAIFYMMQSGVTLSLVNFYPALRHLPNADLTEMYHVLDERDAVLKSVLEKAESEFDHNKQITNYIEGLLKAKHDLEIEHGVGYVKGTLSRDHLEMNIFDMFLGGVETVAATLKWSMLYLVKWPKVQEMCHNEIDRVLFACGDDKVTLKHKTLLPYIEATILESLRLASTLPFGVFHKAREDTEINGYKIKKGTATMINVWSIHHDEKYFKNPLEFQPERFLDSNGRLIKLSELKQFFAFSTGPRKCIGQLLGKTELFLILSNMLFKFNFKSSRQNATLEIYGTTKVTHAPKPYHVYVKRRCHGDSRDLTQCAYDAK